MLVEFFQWWGQQLREAVPPALMARLTAGGAAGDGLIADATAPGTLVLRRRRRGTETKLSQVGFDETGMAGLRATLAARPRGEPVGLRIAASQTLEREVSLPLAAERELERVLGYEMERLTPFSADEVYWGFAVTTRDRVRGRLALQLTVVPKTSVAALLDLLSGQGGRAGFLEAGGRVLKLLHAPPSGLARFGSERVLAVACAVLAILLLASPFARQALSLAEVQARLDAMAPRIDEVSALRRRISGAGTGGDAVVAQTALLGDALAALAAVTEIFPDDAYLTEFTMRERKMSFSGLGASAPKLISALSADPRIRNPAFTAPVTRSETNHMDVFSMRAELAE